MSAEQLIRDLSHIISLPELALDEQGCACLLVDEKLALQIEYDESTQSLVLYCVLGALPAERCEALFRLLLGGNLFGTATSGSTLAIDELNHDIVLWRRVGLESTTADGLVGTIEDMLAATEYWQLKIEDVMSGGSGAIPESEDKLDALHRMLGRP